MPEARERCYNELRNIDLATFIRQVYNWEFELTKNYLYLLPDPPLGVQRLYVSDNIKKGTSFATAAGFERLLPFACKRCGSCPSCGGRRTAERAVALVDEVLPDVTTRRPCET